MKKIIISALSLLLLLGSSQVFAAQNSQIYFSSLAGNYSVGQKITLSVYVQPNGATYDTVFADINFPADKLEVENISLDPSFSTPSPDNSFDNTAGIISYGAGIPSGTNQFSQFATITFNVKNSGNATISFAPDTSIINSGENISASLGGPAVFTLASVASTPTPTVTPKPITKTPAKQIAKTTPVKTAPTPTTQPNPNLAALAPTAVPIVSQAINHSTISFNWIILLLAIFLIAIALFFAVKKSKIIWKKIS